MFSHVYPVTAHQFTIHTSELSALPFGVDPQFEGALVRTLDQGDEVLGLVTGRRRAALKARLKRCRAAACSCFSRSLAERVRSFPFDAGGNAGWAIEGGGRLSSCVDLAEGLPAELVVGGASPWAPSLEVTFDPETGDGLARVDHVERVFRAVPNRAQGLLWWLSEPGDVELVRSTPPHALNLLEAAVNAPQVSIREKLTETVGAIAPLLADPGLCGQASTLLRSGWYGTLPELVDAVRSAATQPVL